MTVFSRFYFFRILYLSTLELPRWLSGKGPICQCRRHQFKPWVGKIPWRKKWQPSPVFLPGKSHGQRSLVGYGPWSQRVGHDWATSLHYIIGTAHSEESRGLCFSLDPANTTGNYRRSINPSNCQISLSSKETEVFWTMCLTIWLWTSDKNQVCEWSLKPTMSQSKEKEPHISHRYFTSSIM